MAEPNEARLEVLAARLQRLIDGPPDDMGPMAYTSLMEDTMAEIVRLTSTAATQERQD